MRSIPVVLLVLPMLALPAAPVHAAAAPTVKRLAVVSIQNGDTAEERTQLADTAYLNNVFFGSSNSLVSWMSPNTFGRLTYAPAGDGVFVAKPVPELVGGSGCRSNDIAAKNAKDFLTAAGVTWDSVAIVYDTGGCPWAGLGQMPGKVTWYTPRPSLAAIAHEMGHNHGYPHEARRDCAGGLIAKCVENSNYSRNTTMGGGGPGRSYSSVELLHSGWIEASWHLQTNKLGAYSLKPLHGPTSVSGTRVVEFKASATRSYVIETRTKGSQVDNGVLNTGVRIYAVTINSSGQRDYRYAYLVNPGDKSDNPYAKAGTVITDAANKLTITVESSSASGARVAFAKLGAKPTPSAQPSPSALPSPSPEVSPAPTGSAEPESDIVTTDPMAGNNISQPTSPKGSMKSTLAVVIIGTLVVLAIIIGFLLAQRARSRRSVSP